MTTGRRTLDPKLDIVFWMLFGEERNRALLISLINAVLQPSAPIEDVEVLHAEPENHSLATKARLYAGQLSRGEGFEALRRCAVVLFTNFRMLAGQRFHSTFGAFERHDAEALTDQLELHVLELPKLADSRDRNQEP